MKSKIEKLGHFLIPCSTDEGVVNVLQRISEKVDELVEVYNSQSQPEKKGITSEEYNKFFNPLVKDTPEEWEDRIRDLILDISADRLVSSEKVVAIVQSLLDDREREVFTNDERYAIEDAFHQCIRSGCNLDKIAWNAREKNWKLIKE